MSRRASGRPLFGCALSGACLAACIFPSCGQPSSAVVTHSNPASSQTPKNDSSTESTALTPSGTGIPGHVPDAASATAASAPTSVSSGIPRTNSTAPLGSSVEVGATSSIPTTPTAASPSSAAPSTSIGAGDPPPLDPALFLGRWNFDALTNNAVADTDSKGVTLQGSGVALQPSAAGQCLSFTGSATASSELAGLDAAGSFSISVWARLEKLNQWTTFVSQDGSHVSSFYLQKRDDDYFAFTTFPTDDTGASPCIASAAIKPKVGEWYHLVATRDAATREQRLYVDGILSGKTTCPGGFTTPPGLVLGRGLYDTPVDYLDGCLDDLSVADRVLTPEQAVDLYQLGRPTASLYLFAYFAEQAKGRGDGLRLGQSHDGLHWGAIGVNKVFMPPSVGGGSFRDPHVMQDPAGTYHLVWTTSCVPWAESGCVQDRGFGHATSQDLVHFTHATYVPIDLKVEHVWAPETFYDAVSSQYVVYWSSPLDTNADVADPHSIYFLRTTDFKTFTPAQVLYAQPNRNFIDATIVQQGAQYLMFLKDEADGQKNIRLATSDTLFGGTAWSAPPSSALTGNFGAEGPSVISQGGNLLLYFDKYGDGAYGALRSNGLSNLATASTWQDISEDVFFAGVRHGTPIQVPWETYRAVAVKAGE
jgi:hypothetical protein